MLLVHHHQRQFRHRRQHREAGAEHDLRVAARRIQPGMRARRVFQRAVQHRDARVRKGMAEARFQLRREADLRYQGQRLPAARHHLGDEPQVDLGLAAAGDAMQQEGPERAERRADPRDGLRLRRVRRRARHELRRRAAGRLRCGLFLFRQRLERAQARRQRARHGLAERPLVVGGEETHQFQPAARQARRIFQQSRHRFQPRARHRAAVRDFHHDADAFARTKRHHHAIAGRNGQRFVAQIVEQLCDRYFKRDAQHAHLQENFPGLRKVVEKAVNNCGAAGEVIHRRAWPTKTCRVMETNSNLRSMGCRQCTERFPRRNAFFPSGVPVWITMRRQS